VRARFELEFGARGSNRMPTLTGNNPSASAFFFRRHERVNAAVSTIRRLADPKHKAVAVSSDKI
jgi:hypothetical protein